MNIELNSVHFGDHLDVMPFIKSGSVDMVFTDLPYNKTKARWDKQIDLKPIWAQYERVIKPNGAIVLTAQAPFDKILACSNLKIFRYEWIWEKTSATGHYNAKKMPMNAHENVLVFYKKLPVYNPQITTGHKPVNSFRKKIEVQNRTQLYGKATKEIIGGGSTERYPRSVIVFSSDKQKLNLHPTQKPVALVEYFIKTYTNPGDLVLDSCAGSGTTGEAAIKTGRNFILIENDEIEFNKCSKRINSLK